MYYSATLLWLPIFFYFCSFTKYHKLKCYILVYNIEFCKYMYLSYPKCTQIYLLHNKNNFRCHILHNKNNCVKGDLSQLDATWCSLAPAWGLPTVSLRILMDLEWSWSVLPEKAWWMVYMSKSFKKHRKFPPALLFVFVCLFHLLPRKLHVPNMAALPARVLDKWDSGNRAEQPLVNDIIH